MRYYKYKGDMMAILSKLLGLRIRELRKSRKLTQSQLAEAIGMETTNLCKLENGGQLPKEENIEKLAKVFDVPIKDLFEFGHLKSRENLQEKLIEIIKNAPQKELELYYKIITDLCEHIYN